MSTEPCTNKLHLNDNDKRWLKKLRIQSFPCPTCDCPKLPQRKLRIEEMPPDSPTGENHQD